MKIRVEGEIDVRQRDKRTWILLQDFTFSHPITGKHTIPRGFVTDAASIPRLVWWMYAPTEYFRAALPHDWLYGTKQFPRAVADSVFFDLLRHAGESKLRSTLMWSAVRVGGWWPWRQDVTPLIVNLQKEAAVQAIPEFSEAA